MRRRRFRQASAAPVRFRQAYGGQGVAIGGGMRGRLEHRLGAALEHVLDHLSGQSELLREAVEERLDRVVVDGPARGAERRDMERRARG